MAKKGKRKKSDNVPQHKRDWFLITFVIVAMIVLVVLLFGPYST